MTISEQFVRSIMLKRDTVTSFDEYPFSIPSLKHLETLEFHPAVTFLIGENGSGKSTLLEAIAVCAAMNAEGGSKNFAFETKASHSVMYEHLRLVRGVARPRDGYFLRAESFYNVATEIDRLDEEPPSDSNPRILDSMGGISLHEQSHGESFFALLTKRFFGNGFYLLDEPEAALSPSRQLSVLTILDDLVRKRSQFVIATHSPIIMAYPNATIYRFSQDAIEKVAYEDTEHYQVYRDFLNRKEAMIEELLSED